MKTNGANPTSARTARTITLYGLQSPSYFALRRHPKIMEAFHLMTPYAMARLNEMATLLERLSKNMDKGVPNLAARRMLLSAGLECVPFQFYGGEVLAYGLRGVEPREKTLLQMMIEDCNTLPIFEDLVGAFQNYGIRLEKDAAVQLSPRELIVLSRAFFPEKYPQFPLFQLMRIQLIDSVRIEANEKAPRPLRSGRQIVLPRIALSAAENDFYLASLIYNLITE